MKSKKLNAFAMVLIQKRTHKINDLGHRAIDPLPTQVREPVLYANALLTQLQMLLAEARTQELHVVPSDLNTDDLDFEL